MLTIYFQLFNFVECPESHKKRVMVHNYSFNEFTLKKRHLHSIVIKNHRFTPKLTHPQCY